jgi:hypothetical protein
MKFNITHNTVYLFDSSFSRASLFEIPTKTNTVFGCNDFSITILSEPAGHKYKMKKIIYWIFVGLKG